MEWKSASFGDVIFNGNIKDIALPRSQQTVQQWFRKDGFVQAPADQLVYHLFQGPLYYSGVRADGLNMWDLSLVKNTNIGERTKIQFRAESFNVFNHPSFTAPNTTVTGGNAFGTVTGETSLPRQLQFGIKVLF